MRNEKRKRERKEYKKENAPDAQQWQVCVLEETNNIIDCIGSTYRLLLLPCILEYRLEPGPLAVGILRVIDRGATGTMQHTAVDRIQPQIRIKEDDPILFRALLDRIVAGCNKF